MELLKEQFSNEKRQFEEEKKQLVAQLEAIDGNETTSFKAKLDELRAHVLRVEKDKIAAEDNALDKENELTACNLEIKKLREELSNRMGKFLETERTLLNEREKDTAKIKELQNQLESSNDNLDRAEKALRKFSCCSEEVKDAVLTAEKETSKEILRLQKQGLKLALQFDKKHEALETMKKKFNQVVDELEFERVKSSSSNRSPRKLSSASSCTEKAAAIDQSTIKSNPELAECKKQLNLLLAAKSAITAQLTESNLKVTKLKKKLQECKYQLTEKDKKYRFLDLQKSELEKTRAREIEANAMVIQKLKKELANGKTPPKLSCFNDIDINELSDIMIAHQEEVRIQADNLNEEIRLLEEENTRLIDINKTLEKENQVALRWLSRFGKGAESALLAYTNASIYPLGHPSSSIQPVTKDLNHDIQNAADQPVVNAWQEQ